MAMQPVVASSTMGTVSAAAGQLQSQVVGMAHHRPATNNNAENQNDTMMINNCSSGIDATSMLMTIGTTTTTNKPNGNGPEPIASPSSADSALLFSPTSNRKSKAATIVVTETRERGESSEKTLLATTFLLTNDTLTPRARDGGGGEDSADGGQLGGKGTMMIAAATTTTSPSPMVIATNNTTVIPTAVDIPASSSPPPTTTNNNNHLKTAHPSSASVVDTPPPSTDAKADDDQQQQQQNGTTMVKEVEGETINEKLEEGKGVGTTTMDGDNDKTKGEKTKEEEEEEEMGGEQQQQMEPTMDAKEVEGGEGGVDQNVVRMELEQQERRTSDLIRKQLTEIEREISRRMQNKNVKKMDEQEMSQLLLDHGRLAGLAAVAAVSTNGISDYANNLNEQQQMQFALPPASFPSCSPVSAVIDPLATANINFPSSLDQLRQQQQMFAAAASTAQQQQITAQFYQQQQPGPLSSNSLATRNSQQQIPFSSFGGPFPATSTIAGHNQIFGTPAEQFVQQQQQFAMPTATTTANNNTSLLHQQQLSHNMAFPPVSSSNFVAAAFLPQQQQQPTHQHPNHPHQHPLFASSAAGDVQSPPPSQQQQQQQQQPLPAYVPVSASQSPSPPMAQMFPPNLSAITPEMAAALLAQLQQHNPTLLQNVLVLQQQQQLQSNATLANATISADSAVPISNNSPRSSATNRISATIGSSSSASSSATFMPPPPDSALQQNGTLANPPPIALLPAPPRAAQYNNVGGGDSNRWNGGGQHHQQRRASLSGGNKKIEGKMNGEMEMVGRAATATGQQRKNSSEWATMGKAGIGGGKEKAQQQQPIWVMRDSYLKRRERDEQKQREQIAGGEQIGIAHSDNAVGNGGEEGGGGEGEMDKLLLNDEGKNGAMGGRGNMMRKGGGGGQNGTTTMDGGALAAAMMMMDDEQQQQREQQLATEDGQQQQQHGTGRGSVASQRKGSKKEVLIHEPAVLIEGVLFRARYLGSTQMSSDERPTKSSRMAQAQEAVARVKAPEGEPQPSTEIDLFISTEKIMVLNTDLQRISETDVRQDILMDHSLRSISYIADIGDLVVLMARRMPSSQQQQQEPADDDASADGIRKASRVICHVFESDEANFIAQSIGQAFQVAYVEFLRANGIEDPNYLRDIDYQEVLNSQEMMAEELELLARKETQKDVVVAKKVGEALGVVIVESGWGSMLPTSVIANMAPGGAAARCNQLNIGDQIIGINGISLVGLPLTAAQQNIKNARSSTAVRLTVVSTPPVVEVRIRRPDTKYQLGFSVQNGVICSLLRGGIAERGGIRVGHRIIEINQQSVVAVPHERIVNMLATATGEIHMKTMPTSMFRLLTGQEVPNYI